MAKIKWVTAGAETPPVKERLLLIISAEGTPPDGQLMGQSDVAVGYWTGGSFRLLTGLPAPRVSHWAALASCLPPGIKLVHQRGFDPDVRE